MERRLLSGHQPSYWSNHWNAGWSNSAWNDSTLRWQRKPGDPRQEADVHARWVDHVSGLGSHPEETEALVRRRFMLRKESFLKLGFTERWAACRAITHGHTCGAHSEPCRNRMEKSWKKVVKDVRENVRI